MDLLPDELQTAIVEAAEAVLDLEASTGRLRASKGGIVADPSVWGAATEQGWAALAVPEASHGLGLGLPELSLVHRALGRTLTGGPFLGTALAAVVAAEAASPLLGDVLAGRPVGLLVPDAEGTTVGAQVTGAFRTDDAEDGQLWLALSPDGAALLEDVAVQPGPASLDLAARWGTANVEAPALGLMPGDATWSAALVLVAAQLSGCAQGSVALSVRHTRSREQFGRPIGSFQMVQQRMADMATRAEAAVQLTSLAAIRVADRRAGARQLAASALLITAEAAVLNARDDIQNHGGLGYTWEVDSHLYLRRAHGLRALLGEADQLRDDVLAGASARPW